MEQQQPVLTREPKSSDGTEATPPKGDTSPPSITLPKGGGAIRGIDEKFAANPVTGTGSMTIPIHTSQARGFAPQLTISYDSGVGNGPYGLGWNHSCPEIKRKVDKGSPRYLRTDESEDVFLLSGAEDLVPVLESDGNVWARETLPTRQLNGNTYRIQRYRPRIEGLFARIERWTNISDPIDCFWRSISKDNITTWYGKTNESRVADPDDPKRIFSWLICQSYDDKGNAILYEYQFEDLSGIDPAKAQERPRVNAARSRLTLNQSAFAQRYLKRIKYGNLKPNRDAQWNATDPALLEATDWMFEVVFDYGEGHCAELPLDPFLSEDQQNRFVAARSDPASTWPVRLDPFSWYRGGFEIRTYRLCRRILMFHHFPDELGIPSYLVRSTDFKYDESPIASFVVSVTQSGYVHQPTAAEPNRYLKKSLPPVEFEYSKAVIDDTVREIDSESLENLPGGLDEVNYRLLDLDGEAVPGILSEQSGGWFYKRNLSPLPVQSNGSETFEARFAPVELVARKPDLSLESGQVQFIDLSGAGHLDLVTFADPTPGFYERTGDESWDPYMPFASMPSAAEGADPNSKFIDLTGDGLPDFLITEQNVFRWYPSAGKYGFGPEEIVRQPFSEEQGPAVVFADGTGTIFLADMTGDGLHDLVRVRNGEVCYWPNLSYGKFGPKILMDHNPWFDTPELFDPRRIRLGDIDGSGTTDIFYIKPDGVQTYYNQSGNSWSAPNTLRSFPHVDRLSTISVLDLLGNGTACLVWSSPLPAKTRHQMLYIDLMGGQKPHLLIRSVNNLGAETVIQYVPSTKFYLRDKYAGQPWITRLPFPVHCVERVETFDRISRNRFVTLYKYHHGYFDGVEREFRGFGKVEQLDAEEFGALGKPAANVSFSSHIPPVRTVTWFHTGAWVEEDMISQQLAHEYFGAPNETDQDFEKKWSEFESALLPDTLLPEDIQLADGARVTTPLSGGEQREAVRALKGSILRQEIYAEDGGDKEHLPYSVSERNYTIECLQRQGSNRHAVFFAHARETIDFHHERKLFPILNGQIIDTAIAAGNADVQWLADPRVTHNAVLEVDPFGNILRSVAIGYGRRFSIAGMPSPEIDLSIDPSTFRQSEQHKTFLTLTEDVVNNTPDKDDWYRVGVPIETRTYELTRPGRGADDWRIYSFAEIAGLAEQAEPIDYEIEPDATKIQKRLIEHVRTVYRPDKLGTDAGDANTLLLLGTIESMVLPGERYRLALTPGLLDQIYKGKLGNGAEETPISVVHDQGGYVISDDQMAAGLFPASDKLGYWWIPTGRIFYTRDPGASAGEELSEARAHFFLPRRFKDPFGDNAFVDYAKSLLLAGTEDAVQNKVTAENDYRVLQPNLITDPNGNRSQVAFDALGLVAGTAVKGKTNAVGDTLTDFDADTTQEQLDGLYNVDDPHAPAGDLLKGATTRIIYDLDRFRRTQQANLTEPANWLPVYAATLARETHVSEPTPPGGLKIQVSFSYSDGFGREIQKKIQAEPGPIIKDGPVVPLRWVGSGWTIFNNKGKPVRQYEPFFSATHAFEFANIGGVSPILFYDPVQRVVATVHPNHAWEKILIDPWRQESWDVNDTVLLDPNNDAVVQDFFLRLPNEDYLPSWYALRTDPAFAAQFADRWPDSTLRKVEMDAAFKVVKHAGTPTLAFFDSLGRIFLSMAHNRRPPHVGENAGDKDEFYSTRVGFDLEGNQREVVDAKGRVVMRYDYDMLGNRVHQSSMEAGERWALNDVTGKPIRAWDSRGYMREMTYDEARRPTGLFVSGNGLNHVLAERTVYGEDQQEGPPDPETTNHRGRSYKVFDAAGIVTSIRYDFKGNLLESTRDLLPILISKQGVNWIQKPAANDGSFTTSTAFDALNRPVSVTSPDRSIYRPAFNEANLLEKIDVNLRGAAAPTHLVTNIDYNAKGQRTLIEYGNKAKTNYEYDDLTFRLTGLRTTRPADGNGLPSQLFADATVVQDLHYAYDPSGNITRIADDSLRRLSSTGLPDNSPCDYTYDALYRLIEATGREHTGQTARNANPQNRRDYDFVGLAGFDFVAHPNDLQAVRRYTEAYAYDAVGNFEDVRHIANGDGWTRTYEYNEASLIEPAKKSNRLTRTTVGNFIETYTYRDAAGNDVDGCMTAVNSMQMAWDFKDQLQQVNLVGGGIAYYVYDAGGQRVHKVIEMQNGTLIEERLYLGGFEIYRKSGANGLVRETLHVMDDKQRIALIETKTQESGSQVSNPQSLIRYQLGNHLGSAALELDQSSGLISYEEYHPYGTTSLQVMNGVAEVSLKRYRYTGKERDEETGLYYHGARYYAPWLGRWCSPDRLELAAGISPYRYVDDQPSQRLDPKGTSGIRFKLGSEDKRPDAKADELMGATEQMAQRTAKDWAEQFGLAVGVKVEKSRAGGVEAVTIDLLGRHDIFGAPSPAAVASKLMTRDLFEARLENKIRTDSVGASEDDIKRKVDNAKAQAGKIREYIERRIEKGQTVEVQTLMPDNSTVLTGYWTEGEYWQSAFVNPYTFFALKGDKWVESFQASSEAAANTLSPGLQLLHELEHFGRYHITGERVIRANSVTISVEKFVSQDVDQATKGLPGLLPRAGYGGAPGKREPLANRDAWFYYPEEKVLTSGRAAPVTKEQAARAPWAR